MACDMIVLFMCARVICCVVGFFGRISCRATDKFVAEYVSQMNKVEGRSVRDWLVGTVERWQAGRGEVRCLNYVSVDGKARYPSIYKQ